MLRSEISNDFLTNNDSEEQQRGRTEGQHLYHASVKECLTQFIHLVQEVATHGMSKAMKVTNQMACLAVVTNLSHVTGA